MQVGSASDLGVGAMSDASHEITTLLSVPLPGAKPVASQAAPFSMIVSWAAAGQTQNGGSPILSYKVFVSWKHAYCDFVLACYQALAEIFHQMILCRSGGTVCSFSGGNPCPKPRTSHNH